MPDPDRVAQQRALLPMDAGRSRVEICEELRISDQQLTRWEESTFSQFGPSGLTQTGHAVLVEGEWKVSRDTWCRRVSMAGVQCPPPED
jgi:hypothetical protein